MYLPTCNNKPPEPQAQSETVLASLKPTVASLATSFDILTGV